MQKAVSFWVYVVSKYTAWKEKVYELTDFV